MAKKKHQTKKHKLKYAEPSGGLTAARPMASVTLKGEMPERSAPVSASGGRGVTARSNRPVVARGASAEQRDFSYVLGDLRRIAIFAVSLVAVELVLWYLSAHLIHLGI